MKAVEFCYWLQGFFELQTSAVSHLNADQLATMKNHLALVFKHEIDPSYGDDIHLRQLQLIHDGRNSIEQVTYKC